MFARLRASEARDTRRAYAFLFAARAGKWECPPGWECHVVPAAAMNRLGKVSGGVLCVCREPSAVFMLMLAPVYREVSKAVSEDRARCVGVSLAGTALMRGTGLACLKPEARRCLRPPLCCVNIVSSLNDA